MFLHRSYHSYSDFDGKITDVRVNRVGLCRYRGSRTVKSIVPGAEPDIHLTAQAVSIKKVLRKLGVRK